MHSKKKEKPSSFCKKKKKKDNCILVLFLCSSPLLCAHFLQNFCSYFFSCLLVFSLSNLLTIEKCLAGTSGQHYYTLNYKIELKTRQDITPKLEERCRELYTINTIPSICSQNSIPFPKTAHPSPKLCH
jgi:hypothetical protein